MQRYTKMNRTTAAIIAALMILTGIAIASGAPGGAETEVGGSERGDETTSGTADLTGGNVTAVNVTGQQNTGRWGGFFGNITGGIQLGDLNMGLFYEWTVTDFTDAYVYVANDSVSDWGLAAATNANQPSYIQGSATDNWTNTFDTTDDFQSSSIALIANVPYTLTYNDAGTGTFRTYSLYSPGSNAYVYAGQAIDSVTGFDGSTVDYQILAPADSGIVSYQFYLELP